MNLSSVFKDEELQPLCQALQIQNQRDMVPAGFPLVQFYFCPKGHIPGKGHWVLAIMDDATQADALGFHDLSNEGLPLGYVFVKPTLAAGDSPTVTASHEAVEMIGNNSINLVAELDDGSGVPSKFYARELCDACEDDRFGYDINGIKVSDFVFPSFFEPFRITGPFDFKGYIAKPFQILTNGYLAYLDMANPSAGWQQTFGAGTSKKAMMKGRPYPGSRRSRMRLPRKEWQRSEPRIGNAPIPVSNAAV